MVGLKRVFVTVIFVPLFYILVKYFSPLPFFILLASGVMIGQYEFYRLFYKERINASIVLGLICGFLLAISFYLSNSHASPTISVSIILILVLITHLFTVKRIESALTDIAVTFFGIFYIGWLMGHIILLRGMGHGQNLIFFLFLVTWAGDAGAYYTGSYLGKHRLSYVISPKKTYEGAVGCLASTILMAFIAKYWFFSYLTDTDSLVLGASFGIISQLGDFSESLLKRSAGVKDSSFLIPAHGGMLDRIDSLLFTAPLLYYYIKFIKG
ncbi:MAG: phosphatidate cytidylyltransferase [Nitrospirae bacterium]|nr:phosphatidate cytidylyltransferase [Nitrospirota bacterium]